MKYVIKILEQVKKQENRFQSEVSDVIALSHIMTILLLEKLVEMKEYVLESGFANMEEEIEFFKTIKPQIQGKLMYYNKVFKMESSCPIDMREISKKYFKDEIHRTEKTCYENCGSSFYRYYLSGRTDKDEEFFTRGKFDINNGLDSHIFESDHRFCTYYDFKVSQIICDKLYHEYLLLRIHENSSEQPLCESLKLEWTNSKTALVELIYALHLNGSISNGKESIRKICNIIGLLFDIELKDVHHTFHRMKYRAGNKASFLEELKESLQNYMDKDDLDS